MVRKYFVNLPMVTKERLNEMFEYKDGELFWKIKTKRPQQKIGDRAGTFIGDGRRYVSVDGVRYGEHRVIYFMHHGYTDLFIDHRDRNPNNNRIDNLRAATKGQNEQNTEKRATNTSGYKGVSFNKRKSKWRATIAVNGKQKSLGYHSSPDVAFAAYKDAAVKFYGEFAHY